MTIATEQVEIAVNPSESGVAWPAVIGGALAAAAVSVALLVLGSGLGLSVASPWATLADTTATLALGAMIWVIVVQWIASALGGYLTGRLRNRSTEPADEVFFRDTANGFLAWALSTVIVAGLLTSAVSAIVGTGAQVAGTVASGVAEGAASNAGALADAVDPTAYFVDILYRPAPGGGPGGASAAVAPAPAVGSPPVVGSPMSPATDDSAVRAETARILVRGLAGDEFPEADTEYLTALVADQAGVTQEVAAERIDGVIQAMNQAKADAQTAADEARKSAATASLFVFLSLLIGAFIAAVAAALGGSHRDDFAGIIIK